MYIVNGTPMKMSITDIAVRCPKCGRMYYIPHSSNGVWTVCPYCGHKA